MWKDLYRIEYFDGEWTVRGEDGWGTYYFGNSYEDCEEWVSEHNGELTEVIEWQKGVNYGYVAWNRYMLVRRQRQM